MSTYLLATMPTTAHVTAMAPIARALIGGGHRVHWYGSRSSRAAIEAAGAMLEPMDSTAGVDEADLAAPHPRGGNGRSSGWWTRRRTGGEDRRRALERHYLDPVPRHLLELGRLTGLLIPDALITSTDFVAGALYAEQTRFPWISVGIDPLPLTRRDAGVLGRYQAIRAQLGLRSVTTCPFTAISGLLHLQNGVPALDPPRELPPQIQHVGALTLTGCLQGQILVTDRGFSTVQTALAHGIPVLVTGGDPEVADRIMWTGAGLHLRRASARRIGRAVARILDEPSFRNAAMSLRDIYHGYDTPAVILKQVEQTTMALMLQR
ncbi:glycosyltransferase [Actinoplanes sp. L3-i22]|uniref:glycosyltransferase n=1 Tax=Actinoplanes sp. L3-i22 TaxID=2836373 RepID=UPI001C79A309|nr:nucleotide disphospho-sugar-binding domain-containing protein [Actinoplanes sp. L3-i22]BCY12108.1 hypothetical protein L3i22_071960 [Actinoplanes sp. L3-i22]